MWKVGDTASALGKSYVSHPVEPGAAPDTVGEPVIYTINSLLEHVTSFPVLRITTSEPVSSV